MALDWENDPMVRIEGILNPFLFGAAMALADPQTNLETLAETCGPTDELLDNLGAEMIEDFGFRFAEEESANIRRALDKVREFRTACERPNADRAHLLNYVQTSLYPAAEDALNAFRAVFIGGIIQVQAAQTQSAKVAVEELSRISRQIQFVAVNASIEAARVGEQGQGFAVIGAEMHRLAQTATETTRRLQKVIDQGPAAEPETIEELRATGTKG